VDGQAGCRCSQFQTRSTILSARVSLASSRSRRRASLEIELLVLRDQLVVLRRQRPVDRGFTEAIACCGPGSTELGHLLESDGAGQARNRGPVAGFRQIPALALKIAGRRTAGREPRNSRADPADEHCQPTLGCAADSLRAAQAGNRSQPSNRRKICDPAAVLSLTNLAKLPRSRHSLAAAQAIKCSRRSLGTPALRDGWIIGRGDPAPVFLAAPIEIPFAKNQLQNPFSGSQRTNCRRPATRRCTNIVGLIVTTGAGTTFIASSPYPKSASKRTSFCRPSTLTIAKSCQPDHRICRAETAAVHS
jgi:hypothetical protein